MADLIFPVDLTNGLDADADEVMANFGAVKALVDDALTGDNLVAGTVTADNLAAALMAILGATSGGVTRRGKTVIAGLEQRANSSYGLLPTADRVSGIVLPTDGLLVVGYRAQWLEQVQGAARAAIFLGADQLKVAGSTAPVVQEASIGSPVTAGRGRPLTTYCGGLACDTTNAAYTGPVSTGQALAPNASFGTGGLCVIEAAAGTYDVSVQFKVTSGNVSVSDRKLRVWTVGF